MSTEPYSPRHTPSPAPTTPKPPKRTKPAKNSKPKGAQASTVTPTSAERGPNLLARLKATDGTVRNGAIGVIVAGAVLFAVAETVTGAAFANGSNSAAKSAAPVADAHSPVIPQEAELTPSTGPQGDKTLAAAPVTVAKKASDSKATISGLAANGIPNVALNAYRVAAARVSHSDPSCGIDWAMLAGIGREESDHGQFAGAKLNANGTSTPRIIGPALTGAQWDYIPAPANGVALDGDAVYAHALGPMQFIPTTWAAYGADGNGDGVNDVFNINDAALGAARYLCAAGGNLRTDAGKRAAILAYNHSDEYLAQVLALAEAYRTGVPVTGIPVGNTTGALPPIKHVSSPPPVNPGGPTALQPAKKPTAKSASKAAAGKSTSAKTATPTGGATTSAGAGGATAATTLPGAPVTTAPAAGATTTTPASTTTTPALPIPLPTTTTPAPAPTSPTSTCKLSLLGMCIP